VTGPRLAAAKLIRLNRRAHFVSWTVAVSLCLGILVALFWAERDSVGPVLKWLRLHGLLCAVLAAIGSAFLVARRRALKRAEYARSWLAAVPVRSSTARWESLAIETLPAIAAIGVLGVLSLACVLLPALAGANMPSSGRAVVFTPVAIAAYLGGGIAAGIVGSFLVPQPKPVILPPGSRYVPHKRVRRDQGVRPSLRALGAWPVRQMFAWAQPKIVSRASIPILVMMPMGTTADAAMVAIALAGTLGALLLLWSAVIFASRAARGWLAPLPARRGVVIRAFLLPVCAVIVAAGAIEALLLLVLNVSYRASALLSAGTALIGCLTVGAALVWNLRPSGTP
jgi:hypothetical protein